MASQKGNRHEHVAILIGKQLVKDLKPYLVTLTSMTRIP